MLPARESGTGQLLLDPEISKNELRAAQAAYSKGKITKHLLQLAEQKYKAAKIFTETDKQTLIAIRSGLSSALIKTEIARQNLVHTHITAPFPAAVGNLKI